MPRRRLSKRLAFERKLLMSGQCPVAGVDEAGRGPLAGPVVAAAVVLPEKWVADGLPRPLRGLNDSKQLELEERERFFEFLTGSEEVLFAVGTVEPGVIDQINILQATYQAMNHSLSQLRSPAMHALVDGLPVPILSLPHTALVDGDSRSYSIAAASVLAKVTRDRLMVAYHEQWPEYRFRENKGYGTPYHLAMLERLGPCPIHRRSFAPLRRGG